MFRFQIISNRFTKLNKFFKRYIIINQDFRNIKTIELSIEKYSKISVNMTHHSIIYSEQQLFLLWGSSSPSIVGEQLVHKKVNLLTYKECCSRPPVQWRRTTKCFVGIRKASMSAISTELFCYFSWQQNCFVDPTKLPSLIVRFKWRKRASEWPPFENFRFCL